MANSARVYGSSGRPGGPDAGYGERPARRGGESHGKRAADLDCGSDSSGAGSVCKKPLGDRECKAKLLKLIAMRDYSVQSMRSKLASSGFEPEVVEHTIEYALRTKFLDDKRYAQSFISGKKEMGWGRGRIEEALAEKGVDCSELAGYPDVLFAEEDEVARALKCVRSHRTSAKNARDAHYRYLISKGYSAGVASRALREFGSAGESDAWS